MEVIVDSDQETLATDPSRSSISGRPPWISPSINVLFLRSKLSYPLSTSLSRNLFFLHHRDIDAWSRGAVDAPVSLDYLLAGCGDINHFLLSLNSIKAMLLRGARRARRQGNSTPFLSVSLLDIFPEIITRDLVCLCCAVWESPEIAYDVWARQYLSRESSIALWRVVAKLKGMLGDDGVVTICDSLFVEPRPSDSEKIVRMLESWEDRIRQMSVRTFTSLRKRWFEKYRGKHDPTESVGFSRACHAGCMAAFVNSYDDVEESIRTGHVDPSLPAFGVNPTFFGMDQEYCVHFVTSPLLAFTRHGSTIRVREFVISLFQSWTEIAKSGVLELGVSICHALEYCDTEDLRDGKKFDFIFTSNLTEYYGGMNLLLCGRKALKNEGYVELESSKLERFLTVGIKPTLSNFLRSSFPFPASFFPSLLGLEVCNEESSYETIELRETAISARLYFRRVEVSLSCPLRLDRSGLRGSVLKHLIELVRDIAVFGGTEGRLMFASRIRFTASRDTMDGFFRILELMRPHIQEDDLRWLIHVLESPHTSRDVFSLICDDEADVAKLIDGLVAHRFEIRALAVLYFPTLFQHATLVRLALPCDWRFNRPPGYPAGTPSVDLRFTFPDRNKASVFSSFAIKEGDQTLVCLRMLEVDRRYFVGSGASGKVCCREDSFAVRGLVLNFFCDNSSMNITPQELEFAPRSSVHPVALDHSPLSTVSSHLLVESEDSFTVVLNVGPDLIDETPRRNFILETGCLTISYASSSSTFVVHQPTAQHSSNPRVLRNRKSRQLYVIYPKTTSTGVSFRKRVSRGSTLLFGSLPKWNHSLTNEVFDLLIQRGMFTMSEILNQQKNVRVCYESEAEQRDYDIRFALSRFFNAFLNVRAPVIGVTERTGPDPSNLGWSWFIMVEEMRVLDECSPFFKILFSEKIVKDHSRRALVQLGNIFTNFRNRSSRLISRLGLTSRPNRGPVSVVMDKPAQTALHDFLMCNSSRGPEDGMRCAYIRPLHPRTRQVPQTIPKTQPSSDVSDAPITAVVVRRCTVCRVGGQNLKCCSRCRKYLYCSRKCQAQHWRAGHRNECRETL